MPEYAAGDVFVKNSHTYPIQAETLANGTYCYINVEPIPEEAFPFSGKYYVRTSFAVGIEVEFEGTWESENRRTNKGNLKASKTSGNQPGIADPGIYLPLDFTQYALPQKVSWVQADFHIGMPHEDSGLDYQHHISWTMDGNGQELDLSQPIEVVLPFVDIDYVKQGHFSWDLQYRIEIKYNHSQSPDFVLHGMVKGEDSYKGPFVSEYDASALPAGMPWKHEEEGLIMDEIIYTPAGVWWKLHYPGNRPTATYLMGENGANSNFAPNPSSFGNDVVDYFEACFLPYPRLKQATQPRSNCYIRVAYQNQEFSYRPPAGFAPFQGPFRIKGSDQPREISE